MIESSMLNDISELIELYGARFINQSRVWYRQYVDRNGKCGYACQKPDMDAKYGRYESLSKGLIARHLSGEITCAWPAIDQNFRGKWLCFDSDSDDGQLERLGSFLLECGWYVIREGKRVGRDGHLWILLDAPVEARLLIWLGDAMMRLAGVSGLELFPKYPSGLSQVRGPLGKHNKPTANGAIGWFEDVKQDLREQLEWLASQPLNNAESAIQEAHRHRPIILPKRMYTSPLASKGSVMFDIAVQRTSGKKGGNDWYHGHCPGPRHKNGDRHQSLSLRRANDGGAIVHCWTGCQPKEIYAALTHGH